MFNLKLRDGSGGRVKHDANTESQTGTLVQVRTTEPSGMIHSVTE